MGMCRTDQCNWDGGWTGSFPLLLQNCDGNASSSPWWRLRKKKQVFNYIQIIFTWNKYYWPNKGQHSYSEKRWIVLNKTRGVANRQHCQEVSCTTPSTRVTCPCLESASTTARLQKKYSIWAHELLRIHVTTPHLTSGVRAVPLLPVVLPLALLEALNLWLFCCICRSRWH